MESLDRLGDRSWPRDQEWTPELLRCAFFLLMNKDLGLKQRALDGIPPLLEPLDPRKAERFFLALEPEAVRPFFTNQSKPHGALVDAVKNLYLVC